jgi:uncharacterized protein DUF4279
MSSALDDYASFEDQLNAILDIIESKIDIFKPICEKYRCTFVCAIYLIDNNGESLPSVYLHLRHNKIDKILNVELDLGLYILRNHPEN